MDLGTDQSSSDELHRVMKGKRRIGRNSAESELLCFQARGSGQSIQTAARALGSCVLNGSKKTGSNEMQKMHLVILEAS